MKALAPIATAALIVAFGSAYAAQQITHVSVFARGAAVSGTAAPDSVTTGNGSVWPELMTPPQPALSLASRGRGARLGGACRGDVSFPTTDEGILLASKIWRAAFTSRDRRLHRTPNISRLLHAAH